MLLPALPRVQNPCGRTDRKYEGYLFKICNVPDDVPCSNAVSLSGLSKENQYCPAVLCRSKQMGFRPCLYKGGLDGFAMFSEQSMQDVTGLPAGLVKLHGKYEMDVLSFGCGEPRAQ